MDREDVCAVPTQPLSANGKLPIANCFIFNFQRADRSCAAVCGYIPMYTKGDWIARGSFEPRRIFYRSGRKRPQRKQGIVPQSLSDPATSGQRWARVSRIKPRRFLGIWRSPSWCR